MAYSQTGIKGPMTAGTNMGTFAYAGAARPQSASASTGLPTAGSGGYGLPAAPSNTAAGTAEGTARFNEEYAKLKPQLDVYDNNALRINNQAGLYGGYLDQQRGSEYTDYNLGNERLNNRVSDLAAQRDTANRQTAFIGDKYRVAEGQYNNERAFLGRLREFATADANRQYGKYQQDLGFVDRTRTLGRDQSQLAFDQQSRQATSSAIQQGSRVGTGYQGGIDMFARGQQLTNAGLDMSRDRSYADLNDQQAGRNTQLERDRAGFDNRGQNADSAWANTQLDTNNAYGAASDKLIELDNMARDYGVDRKTLDAALAKGLAAIGYNDANAAFQLNEALASNNESQRTAALQLTQMALNNTSR
jgi:hypothetical protein